MIPELSRPVRIDTLGAAPHAIALTADPAERSALAARFAILSVDRLEARAQLSREGEAVIAVGRLSAAVTQACVASGEPVEATLDEPFALRFVPEGAGEGEGEIELGEADLDQLSYQGGAVDLGEAVAQTLALALDPFPRSPSADEALRAAGVVGEEDVGPFSVLRALRDKRG